jgi:hypothetical protein
MAYTEPWDCCQTLFVFLAETMKLLKFVLKRYITVHSEYKKLHNTTPVFLLKASIHMKE